MEVAESSEQKTKKKKKLAPPSTTSIDEPKRTHSDPNQKWAKGERKGLAMCGFCESAFTANNGHGCAAKSWKIVVSGDSKGEGRKEEAVDAPAAASTAAPTVTTFASTPNDSFYQVVNTSVRKMYLTRLTGAVSSSDKSRFIHRWLNQCVERQHCIIWFASRLIHGYIVYMLQDVTIDNVHEYMLSSQKDIRADKTRLVVNQTLVKQAFSLVCKKGARNLKDGNLIEQYYNREFLPHRPHVQESLGDALHLSGTSLQYAAQQLAVNHGVMMGAQIWKRTAYWVRKEMDEIILQRIDFVPVFHEHKTKIVRALYHWLNKYVMHEKATKVQPSLAGQSEEKIHEAWRLHIQAKISDFAHKKTTVKKAPLNLFETESQQQAWKAIWTDLYTRVLRPVLGSLLVFETKHASESSTQSQADMHEGHVNDDEEEESTHAQASRAFIGCRRAEWLYAILKRLEVMQQSITERFLVSPTINDSGPTMLHLHNVFPLAGNIPGHIMCTEQLLLQGYKLYLKQSGAAGEEVEEEEVEKPSAVGLEDWMKLFLPTYDFWKKKEQGPDRGCSRVRLRNKFTTDGISVSLLETTLVWKRKYNPPVVPAADIPTTAIHSTPPICNTLPTLPPMPFTLASSPSRQPPIRKSYLPYIDTETIEGLEQKGVEMVLVLDPGRRHMVDGKFFSMQQLRDDASKAQASQEGEGVGITDDTMVMTSDYGSDEKEGQEDNEKESTARIGMNPFAVLMDQPNVHAGKTGATKRDARQERKLQTGIDFQITAAERAFEYKTKKHAQLRQRLEQEEKTAREEKHLPDFFSSLPSLKSSSPNAFPTWMASLCEGDRCEGLLQFYGKPIFRHLRMDSYSSHQRWWVYVQDKIYRTLAQHNLKLQIPRYKRPYTFGDPKPNRPSSLLFLPKDQPRPFKLRTNSLPAKSTSLSSSSESSLADQSSTQYGRLLIILGDGSFQHNSRGHASTPTAKRVFDELTKLGEIVRWVDEHRTSKCCSSCGNDMEEAVLQKKPHQPPRLPDSKRREKRAIRKDTRASRFRIKHRLSEPTDTVSMAAPSSFTASSEHASSASGVATSSSSSSSSTSSTSSFRRPRRNPPRVDGDALVVRTQRGIDGQLPGTIASDFDAKQLLKPWGLKHCTYCNRLWNRDKCACHNFWTRTRWLLSQPLDKRMDGPIYLLRQPKTSNLAPTTSVIATNSAVPDVTTTTTAAPRKRKRQPSVANPLSVPVDTSKPHAKRIRTKPTVSIKNNKNPTVNEPTVE